MRRTRANSGRSAAAVVVEGLEGRQLFAVGLSLLPTVDDGSGTLAPASAASLTEAPTSSPDALNAVLYDSGGFESPRFAPGGLAGQDAAQMKWLKFGSPTAAVVQTAVVAHGAQAVRLDRVNAQDARFAPVQTVAPVTDPITINWTMRVDSASSAPGYGPFFGVEAYHDVGNGVLRLIGTGGVDARSGEILMQIAGSGFLDTTGVSVSLGQFHSFRLVLDYVKQQYELFVDQASVQVDGFVDSTPVNPITGFSLASLTTFAVQGDAASQAAAGTAYFDDYKVTAGVVSAPQVSTFTVDDGTAQRSNVRSVTVKFDQSVTLAAGAFSLSQLNTGGSGANNGSAPTDASTILGTPTSSDGGTTWLVPFNGASPFAEQRTDGTPTGSVVDGIYTFSVDPSKVTAGGVAMAAPASMTFHRLFGDIDGNKKVNTLDFGNFRNAFGKNSGNPGYNAVFDFDGSGGVNNLDYGQFRRRYSKEFTY